LASGEIRRGPAERNDIHRRGKTEVSEKTE
jgi:hypothetical protein